MSLSSDLTKYLDAGFPGIWVQSVEPHEAESEIIKASSENGWTLVVWDAARDIVLNGQSTGDNAMPAEDRLKAALRTFPTAKKGKEYCILLVHNLHLLLKSTPIELVQTLYGQLVSGKSTGTFVVALSATTTMPQELEKMFVVLDHALPSKDELAHVIASVTGDEVSWDAVPASVLEAAAGLTRMEAENAAALSWSTRAGLEPEVITEIKAGVLRKSGLLTLHRGAEHFADLGGLDTLKDFAARSLRCKKKHCKPRGIMLLGVPGTGKSAFAKALGNETKRPTLILDIGAMMNSLVGASEERIRNALAVADAMAPCVLFVDEIEKALAGIGGDNTGVTQRIFGTLLSWLNDHTTDVYFICTSNDISKLPPEFTRAERFDATFFLDTPTSKEKDLIWAMYAKLYGNDAKNRPDDTEWTGAEIKACCRLSALLDVPLTQAAKQVVPVAQTAAESISRLRTFANNRFLSANIPGVYVQAEMQKEMTRAARAVRKGTSTNN